MPEALRSLNVLVERVGGTTGISVNELAITDDDDSGLEEFKSEQGKVIEGLMKAPPSVILPADAFSSDPTFSFQLIEPLLNELCGLREELASLRARVNDIQQGTTV